MVTQIEKPQQYNEGTPERVAAGFINAWGDRNWEGMVDYLQLSWVSKQRNPKKQVKGLYSLKKLKEAHIVKSKTIAGFMVDITLEVRYTVAKRSKTVNIIARIMKETAPYKPSIDEGQWGLNPISTLRETEING